METRDNDRLELLLRGQANILQQLHGILEAEQKHDDAMEAYVLSSLGPGTNVILDPEPWRVFRRDEIKDCCVKYRLRFLPAGRFKGRLPMQALYALRQLEVRTVMPLEGFLIMAPAKRFKLCDCDSDPMLFVPLDDDLYYLVHRWGADMKPWRALTGWPVRGWKELAITVLVVGLIVGALLPTSFLSTDPSASWWDGNRLFGFFWTIMLLAASTVFSWFTFFGQFSSEAWNSKTFN
jgi:hypothetical protein